MRRSRLTQAALALGFSLGMSGPSSAAAAKPADLAAPNELESALRNAQIQRQGGDLDGATRTLSQLVLVAPDDPRILAEYGKTLLDRGDIEDALAFLQRAVELRPGDWSLHSAQGVAYTQRGNYPAAQAAFARALTMKPGDASVLNNQALAHLQTGNLDAAEQLLYQAIQAGAQNPRVAQNLALVQNLKQAKAAAAVSAPLPSPAASAAPAETLPEKREQGAPPPVPDHAAPQVAVSLPEPVVQTALPEVPLRAVKEAPAAKTVKFPAGPVFIQIASYNAEQPASRLAAKVGMGARVSEVLRDGRPVYRVRIGPVADHDEARALLARVQALGFRDAQPFGAGAAPALRPGAPSLRLSDNRDSE